MVTGKQLKEAREAMKLSAARVAEKLGVSITTIYAWEGDASKPRDPKLQKKLHDLLGIKPEEAKEAAARKRAVVSEEGKEAEATRRHDTFSLVNIVTFFLKDQGRRSTVAELLLQAKKHGLTLDDLIGMFESVG